MKLSTRIRFFHDGVTILTMEQWEVQRAGKNIQYEFSLFNAEGARLGVLNTSLTEGYGYNRAIGLVSKALLPLFPELQLEVDSVNLGVNPHKWNTGDIKEVVHKEMQ